MSVEISVRVRNMVVKVTGEKQSETFDALSAAMECFCEKTCGHCKGEDIVFRTRRIEDNSYRELLCLGCGYVLTFGTNKKDPSKIFPRRKLNAEGKPDIKGTYDKKCRGWVRGWEDSKNDDHDDGSVTSPQTVKNSNGNQQGKRNTASVDVDAPF